MILKVLRHFLKKKSKTLRPMVQVRIITSTNQIYLFISHSVKQTGDSCINKKIQLLLYSVNNFFLSVAFLTKKEQLKQTRYHILHICVYLCIYVTFTMIFWENTSYLQLKNKLEIFTLDQKFSYPTPREVTQLLFKCSFILF